MRAIELNGCSGGMAEGFRRAGITFTWCFDWDPDACASYEKNLGHRPVRMDIRDLVRMAREGWSPGPLDLLVADPPCTPWSRAGKRLGTEDERDMLEETCDLIALLRPRAYLIGNVPGLQDSTSWHIVQRVIGGLERHGYCVADYAQLDAADYGVPQRRIRPFWYGHLAGPCLTWPAPTHGAPTVNGALPGLGLRPWVTCREALADLPAEEMGRPVRLRWKPTDDHRPTEPTEPAKTITRNTHSDGCLISVGSSAQERARGDHWLDPRSKHAPNEPDRPSKTLGAKERGNGPAALRISEPHGHPTSKLDDPAWVITADGGRGGKRSSVIEPWPWDRPSTTVAQDERIPPPGHHDANSYLSTPNAIVLSERAAAILQGFPEGWVFVGKTKKARWSQLGQAVPPGLAEPVARAIVQQLAATEAGREECA